MTMHPAAAQSLLAPRPSKVVPFFAFSVVGHVTLICVGLVANWLIAPKIIDLDQKPIHATLVRLGKERDEKLLPRKEEPPPPPPEEKAPEPVAIPVAAPKAIPIPGLEVKKAPSKDDGKKEADAKKRLASAFSKMTALKPEEAEGSATGDVNGDSAREEGERYFGLISSAVRRYYDVSNTIPEAERRTLKAEVGMRVGSSGEVSDVRIKKSSGNDLFDSAVLSAVKKAAPFSPPPETLRKVLSGGVTLVFSP
jgi:TonB family protein